MRAQLTNSAARSERIAACVGGRRVVRTADLIAAGWTSDDVRTHVRARRWSRHGRAVVLHSDDPTRRDLFEIARLNTSPRALWTAFTAAEILGLSGWERDAVHLLVPGGLRPSTTGVPVPVRLHRGTASGRRGQCEPAAASLARAATTLSSPRSACGLLAAGVQQRLVTAADLRQVVSARPRLRHRGVLLLALADIEQGAEALSEIDFARLCRAHGLPPPTRQAVRIDSAGRRRYLDAEWLLDDGRRVVVEIDGALHLIVRNWWSDQLRQNELVLAGATVLRFPSAVLRSDPGIVMRQLKHALRS
jgi:hypothetical protein